ncbi:PREDICTED: uncharacterized protein LOC104750448 [Camelina sativa]|uniref:Uncharacterized protein LOC104750448 n=1 Tax=Camelina sativa TaxID=90675 RepID=A0ABM0WFY0_CAMSA|nr:PREDICTED: uncharacterized protein LOC104750448 [Camelina sativa]
MVDDTNVDRDASSSHPTKEELEAMFESFESSCCDEVMFPVSQCTLQIDELEAWIYPPQEIDKMKQTVKIIQGNLDEVETQVKCLKSSTDGFTGACAKLRNSFKHMETELDKRSEVELNRKGD